MALPLLFALSSEVEAVEATVRIKARLREGPNKQTTLLGWVDAGSVVEVVEEKSGWRRVQLPDGRSGYVWGDHFAKATAPADPVETATVARAEAAAPPTTIAAPATAAAPGTPDDLRALRAEVEALRNRPESTALEQLRGEVGRLAAAQQEMARRLDARGPAPGGSTMPPIEGTASAAAVFLVAGGLVGWIASRLMQRWRDRRSRIRI